MWIDDLLDGQVRSMVPQRGQLAAAKADLERLALEVGKRVLMDTVIDGNGRRTILFAAYRPRAEYDETGGAL